MAEPRFTSRLPALLAERGWTLREFARRVGVEPSVVHGMLHGAHAPSVLLAGRLAEVLGVTVDALGFAPEGEAARDGEAPEDAGDDRAA